MPICKTMTVKNSRFLSALQLFFLLILGISILRSPAAACSHASLALTLWLEKMIPSLFPFMILSGLIVRLDFSRSLSIPVYPLLGRLYRISKTMCTTLIMGFLFGFPLGAKTIAEEYSLGQLTKSQAQYLLSFCNNIGPVYLLSFALPLLGLSENTSDPLLKHLVTVAFFAVPLLYGLVLRYTVYRRIPLYAECTVPQTQLPRMNADPQAEPTGIRTYRKTPGRRKFHHHAPLIAASAGGRNAAETPSASLAPGASAAGRNTAKTPSFLPALDASITSACAAITRLGGYMIFFIVCNLPLKQAASFIEVPVIKTFAAKSAVLVSPILEITSGLALAKDILSPALFMTMLTFGGLSCFAQTYTCIRDTDLSFGHYCLHKIFQTAIAFCLYSLLFSVFSGRQLL